MVMFGHQLDGRSSNTYYELSVYEMATHDRIMLRDDRSEDVLAMMPRVSDRTLFYRSCSPPGFGFAWLWRCCFGLPGDVLGDKARERAKESWLSHVHD
jgi:hypothetical protein